MLASMVTVVITSRGPKNASRYKEVMERLSTDIRLLLPKNAGARPTDVLRGTFGLLQKRYCAGEVAPSLKTIF